MGFVTSIKTCFTKYATFKGRASRSEFWYFMLFGVIVDIFSGILDAKIAGQSFWLHSDPFSPVTLVTSAALLLPSTAVTARRLHDIGKSGWWQLMSITSIMIFYYASVAITAWQIISITIIGIIPLIVLIVWLITRTDDKENAYGKPPQ